MDTLLYNKNLIKRLFGFIKRFVFSVDSPLRSCGLGTATTSSRSRLGIVATLESITLLVYPRFRFVRLASRATSCTSAMMEFMPCALAPAYGVTSICRFFQAVTALSIVPTVSARCLCCHWGCTLFICLLSFISFCYPSRHIASAFPHVNRRPSSALHPVFIQLVPTACFVEGGGFEPPYIGLMPCSLAVVPQIWPTFLLVQFVAMP